MGKISEGEELTVSYVDFLNLSADRQKKLKEDFHFQCSCEHCSQRVKDDLMMAAAESEGNKVGLHMITVAHKSFSFLYLTFMMTRILNVAVSLSALC